MQNRDRKLTLSNLWLAILFFATLAYADESDQAIEEIVVVGSSSIQSRLGVTGSSSVIYDEEIRATGATHVNEILARVPGVWISRGSGQEHLAAIRSAVYTGAGACG